MAGQLHPAPLGLPAHPGPHCVGACVRVQHPIACCVRVLHLAIWCVPALHLRSSGRACAPGGTWVDARTAWALTATVHQGVSFVWSPSRGPGRPQAWRPPTP